jgi:hypothetical protein
MGTIFRQACPVYACVGSHQDDSEHLYALLDLGQREFEELFESYQGYASAPEPHEALQESNTLRETGTSVPMRRPIYAPNVHWPDCDANLSALRKSLPEMPLLASRIMPEVTRNVASRKVLAQLNDGHFSRLHHATKKSAQRPYWQRAWTLQELILPFDGAPRVLCGTGAVSWLALLTLVVAFTKLEDPFVPACAFLHRDWTNRELIDFRELSGMMTFLRFAQKYGMSMWIFRNLETLFAYPRACSDIRDRIYATHELLNLQMERTTIEKLYPDYSRTPFQLARATVVYYYTLVVSAQGGIFGFARRLLAYLRVEIDNAAVIAFLRCCPPRPPDLYPDLPSPGSDGIWKEFCWKVNFKDLNGLRFKRVPKGIAVRIYTLLSFKFAISRDRYSYI